MVNLPAPWDPPRPLAAAPRRCRRAAALPGLHGAAPGGLGGAAAPAARGALWWTSAALKTGGNGDFMVTFMVIFMDFYDLFNDFYGFL